MTIILENLINLLFLFLGTIIESLIHLLMTPAGFIMSFVSLIFIFRNIAKSINKDIKNLVIFALLPRLYNIRHKYTVKVEFMPK